MIDSGSVRFRLFLLPRRNIKNEIIMVSHHTQGEQQTKRLLFALKPDNLRGAIYLLCKYILRMLYCCMCSCCNERCTQILVGMYAAAVVLGWYVEYILHIHHGSQSENIPHVCIISILCTILHTE